MSKETIIEEIKLNVIDIIFNREAGWNDKLDKIIDLWLTRAIDQTKKETREETIIEAVRKIEKLRKQVAKQAGLRYDEQYENCIDVLNKLKK